MQFLIHITDVIKDVIGVDLTEDNSRKRNTVDARRIYSDIAKEHTDYTLSTIGEIIKRDHASVLHQIRTSGELKETDRDYRKMYEKVYASITMEPRLTLLEQSYFYHYNKCIQYKNKIDQIKATQDEFAA